MKKLYFMVMLCAIVLTSCGGSSKTETKIITVAEAVDGVQRTSIAGVQGLCEMCKDRIESTAMAIDGIQSATWDATSKNLVLTSAQTLDVEAVSKALAAVGHDTGMHKANDKTYNALPGCCKYR